MMEGECVLLPCMLPHHACLTGEKGVQQENLYVLLLMYWDLEVIFARCAVSANAEATSAGLPIVREFPIIAANRIKKSRRVLVFASLPLRRNATSGLWALPPMKARAESQPPLDGSSKPPPKQTTPPPLWLPAADYKWAADSTVKIQR